MDIPDTDFTLIESDEKPYITYAEKHGTSKDEAEKKWSEAEKKASEELGVSVDKFSGKEYGYTMSIFKKMIGVKESFVLERKVILEGVVLRKGVEVEVLEEKTLKEEDTKTSKLESILVNAVTEYDRKQKAGKYYNMYALPQYLQALEGVMKDIKKGTSIVDAIDNYFDDRLANALKKSVSNLKEEDSYEKARQEALDLAKRKNETAYLVQSEYSPNKFSLGTRFNLSGKESSGEWFKNSDHSKSRVLAIVSPNGKVEKLKEEILKESLKDYKDHDHQYTPQEEKDAKIWWRSLSINQQKEFEKQGKAGGVYIPGYGGLHGDNLTGLWIFLDCPEPNKDKNGKIIESSLKEKLEYDEEGYVVRDKAYDQREKRAIEEVMKVWEEDGVKNMPSDGALKTYAQSAHLDFQEFKQSVQSQVKKAKKS